jgi:hypothetical protein
MSLPTASKIEAAPSKKERTVRSIEEILDALQHVENTIHELRIDLKKAKKVKTKKSTTKGETPPQTKPWNDFVKKVHEEMKAASPDTKVLYKDALKEASRRKTAEKGTTVEQDDSELVPWTFKGVEYLRSSANELWLNKDGEIGKWVGVYDPETKKIDKKAKEPEISVSN